ncbi:unnamed protein product, partial [Thlaspi arvense]
TLKITPNRCPDHTRAAATVSDQAKAYALVSVSVRRSVHETTPSHRVLDHAATIHRRRYLSSKLRPLYLFPVVGVATSLSVP